MLGWFKKWFRKTPPQDAYLPRERVIYSYFDGEKEVQADPMILYKGLMDVWPELKVDMALAASESKDARKGHDNQVSKVRKVFEIKPFKEGGLTETESMGVFYDFWWWSEELKKNYPPTPTSPEATSPTSASTSDASPPTSNGSPSGSTGSENSTEGPTPSS